MKKQLKFVDGVYGFVYDSVYGEVTQTFTKPVSKTELKTMKRVIGEDDVLFVVGDEDDIREMFDLDNSPDLDEFSDAGPILEWK
jgi:hypothetical protein